MVTQTSTRVDRTYLISVLLLMVILPVGSMLIDIGLPGPKEDLTELVGKWFTFWAIGLRLFTAGIRQSVDPAFTAQAIFHLKNKESFIVVRELGYANTCLAILGIVSLFLPEWRQAAACSGGLFFGIAGINHVIKRPVSANEWIAMVSDLFIAVLMVVYLIY